MWDYTKSKKQITKFKDIFQDFFYFIEGGCMRKLNVTHGDSRDEQKLKRFFPFEPRDHIIPSRLHLLY